MGIPLCPITQEAIKIPVIDPEGNTYEKDAIEEWLKNNSVSPLTRSPLLINDLVPNRAIIEIIDMLSNSHISNNTSRSNNNLKNCSKCGKEIKVSSNYKGKQEPMCFKCRPWNCKICTYLNNSQAKKCLMCETMRD